jgi:hypothetical protein
VELGAKYGKTRMSMHWLWIGLVVPVGFVWFRKGKRQADGLPAPFVVPDEITPLSVIGLLQRIHRGGNLDAVTRSDLDRTLASLKSHYYTAAASMVKPDLACVAKEWVAKAGNAA